MMFVFCSPAKWRAKKVGVGRVVCFAFLGCFLFSFFFNVGISAASFWLSKDLLLLLLFFYMLETRELFSILL